MKTIIIPQATNDSFIEVLRTLYLTLQNTTAQESYKFDLEQCQWVHPLLVLPLSAFINVSGSTYLLDGKTASGSYLNTICFPQGISALSPLQHYAQSNATKSYTPISVLKQDMSEQEREKLQTQFDHMILQVLQPAVGAANAVYYPLSELVTNIFDHSYSNQGYLFGQYYSTKQFLDICIVDTGRGLVQNYVEEKGLNFTDEQAIQEALQGHSTKPSKERGFGVRTSKDVVCKALEGVIIAYRIPRPTTLVDITPFLE